MKSPPPRAFSVPDVHPRLRKCLSRCTLDCGFKTSESPALRGFVAGLRALATAALYLVLKSNGPHRSKNLPVKFDFSPIDTSANIAKKLPSQRCFKPLFIASFNFSHKRRNVRFKGLRRVHTPPHPRIVHTAAYTPKQGLFRMGVVSLLSERSARSPTSPGRVSERQVLPLLGLGRGCSQRTQKAFGTAMRLCASLFRGVAAPLGCVICLQLGDVAVFSLCAQYFLNVRGGGGITTLGAFHTVRKPCVAGYQNGKFCRFWVLVGDAPEERRKPSEQRCAYARRCSEGVAAPLGCVICLQLGDVAVFFTLCAVLSECARQGGITTLGVLYVLLKRRTAACQSGSFAVF